MNVLIVDDQRSARRILASILAGVEGLALYEAGSLAEARKVLSESAIELAYVDIRLGEDARNRDGLTLVREIAQDGRAAAVVVTASSEMAEVRTAMRHGAKDYVLKDELCEEMILPFVERWRARAELEREVLALRARVAKEPAGALAGLVGTSAAMERLRAVIKRAAVSDRPVLVIGPTGAGKEVVVRAVHALGPRPDAPLLDLNCGAIPEALIESQLFGHEKGAFTGADKRAPGYLAAVHEGTLFLDEIAELPLALQARLLRVLETRTFRAVGSTAESRFEGRVVAATHADLEERVRRGTFREDLFYRLNVLMVRVPSLDERREDIPALVAHFAQRQGRPLRFASDAVEALQQRAWPGNVRQLRNVVDRVAVFADDDVVTAETLASLAEGGAGGAGGVRAAGEGGAGGAGDLRQLARAVMQLPAPDKLAAIEEALIAEAMALAGGNKSGAARLLGVHRKVIERRLERAGEDDGGGA